MDTKHSMPWRQILQHRVIIEPWMPFSHPSKGKISTSNQVEFYQKMNSLACPESLEQCRGDDLGGVPRAGQDAGWRPRESHSLSAERPAPAGRAGCASGRLTTPPRRAGAGRRRRNPSTVVWPKAGWSRQERQRRRTGVTSATTMTDQ
jgi:hypothetical protein